MSGNLQETIRESAKAPAKASGDAGSVEQHKLTEQIAADKYLASKAGPPLNRSVAFDLTTRATGCGQIVRKLIEHDSIGRGVGLTEGIYSRMFKFVVRDS